MTTGERLRLVRQAADYDVGPLSELVGLTEEELLAYEAGGPSEPEVLWNLAYELGIDLAFFLRTTPMADVVPLSTRLEGVDEDDQVIALAQTRVWVERYMDIENHLPLTSFRFFQYPAGFPHAVSSAREAVAAAKMLRETWGLGTAPIKSVAELLEEMGVKVGLISAGDLDACAFYTDVPPHTPLIVVSQDISGEEQRFALARELAYIMLEDVTPQFAAHFAGAFLIPAEALRRDLGDERTELHPIELYMLKQKYGMSIRALVTRAASVRLIPQAAFKQWNEQFREEEWVSGEPGLELLPEVPSALVRLALRLEAEGTVDEDRTMELLILPWLDWESILGIPSTEEFEAEV